MNQEAVELVALCKEKGLTIGSVESMSAGAFGSAICAVPGASSVYVGGVISYTARIKEKLIGVSEELINEKGVVSKEVALSMAYHGHETLGCDICVSVTGNAGPTAEAGKAEVGEVYIGVYGPLGNNVACNKYQGERNAIRQAAVEDMIRLALLEAKKS